MAYDTDGYKKQDNYGSNGSGYKNGYGGSDNYGPSRYGNGDPYPNRYGKNNKNGPKKSGGLLQWVGVAVVLGIYLNYLS